MNKARISIGIALAALGAGIAWVVWDCHHKFSRPFTWRKDRLRVSYVVCLECGKEFRYDLDSFVVKEQIHINNVVM